MFMGLVDYPGLEARLRFMRKTKKSFAGKYDMSEDASKVKKINNKPVTANCVCMLTLLDCQTTV